MKRIVPILTRMVVGAMVLGWLSAPVYAQGRAISIKGSDTMVILGQRWAEVYMSKHPGVTLQVTGGGSGVGLAALINGGTDIAESSRPMKDQEKADVLSKRGREVVEVPVALDGVAIPVPLRTGRKWAGATNASSYTVARTARVLTRL